MNNIEEKILKYNTQIQEAEKEKAIVDDKIKSILEKLQIEYNLNEKDLPSILDKLKNDCAELDKEIIENLAQLEKSYSWEDM